MDLTTSSTLPAGMALAPGDTAGTSSITHPPHQALGTSFPTIITWG